MEWLILLLIIAGVALIFKFIKGVFKLIVLVLLILAGFTYYGYVNAEASQVNNYVIGDSSCGEFK